MKKDKNKENEVLDEKKIKAQIDKMIKKFIYLQCDICGTKIHKYYYSCCTHEHVIRCIDCLDI